MKPFAVHLTLTTLLSVAMFSCTSPKDDGTKASGLTSKINRFVPVTITGDTSRLSEGDRGALHKLIAAAGYIARIFMRQVWSGNEALSKRLEADSSPEVKMIQRTSLDPDQNFVILHDGIGSFFIPEFVYSSVLVKDYRLHGYPLSN